MLKPLEVASERVFFQSVCLEKIQLNLKKIPFKELIFLIQFESLQF